MTIFIQVEKLFTMNKSDVAVYHENGKEVFPIQMKESK